MAQAQRKMELIITELEHDFKAIQTNKLRKLNHSPNDIIPQIGRRHSNNFVN